MDKRIEIKGSRIFRQIDWIDSYETQTSSKFIRCYANDSMVSICYGPTINCQWLSLGNIQSILDKIEPAENILKELLHIIRVKDLDKPMIMVDVRDRYVNQIKDLFKPYLKKNNYTESEITLESPYKSTNGSDMCILLLNINWYNVPLTL